MVKELIFHLGDPKTGTTSIQSVLAEKRFAIKGKRVVYPARINHIPLVNALSKQNEQYQKQAKLWGHVAEQFNKSTAEFGVISAEEFAFLDPQKLVQAIDTYLPEYKGRIRLISYVRPHAERLASGFGERRKKGLFDGSMDELHAKFLDMGLLNYVDRFAKWKAIFGDALTIKPMVRSHLTKGDVVLDFFGWMVGDTPFEIKGPTATNEALSTAELAAMTVLYSEMAKLPPELRQTRSSYRAFGWNFTSILGAIPRTAPFEKPRLHRSLAEKVVETYKDDAAEMDRLYFTGTPLSDALKSAPSKAIDSPQPLDPESYFDGETIRVLQGMATVLKNMLITSPEAFVRSLRNHDDPQPLQKPLGANKGATPKPLAKPKKSPDAAE